MKYIMIGKVGQIATCWAIELFSHIPSTKGDDVILITTMSGTAISIYGYKNCERFLKEMETPLLSMLNWTSETVTPQYKGAKSLAYFTSNGVMQYDY